MSRIDLKKWQCYMSLSHILPDIHCQIEEMAFKGNQHTALWSYGSEING